MPDHTESSPYFEGPSVTSDEAERLAAAGWYHLGLSLVQDDMLREGLGDARRHKDGLTRALRRAILRLTPGDDDA